MPGRRQFLAINTPEARKVDLPTTSLPQALARNDTFAKRVEPMDSLIDLVFAWKIRESRPAGLGTARLPATLEQCARNLAEQKCPER